MSYTKTVEVEMEAGHLPFLEMACADLGLNFVHGQTTYKTHEGERSCDHAITMIGASHSIGVVSDGDVFNLAADFYLNQKFSDVTGVKFETLMQRLSTNMSKHELYERGARDIREEYIEEDQRVRLVATF